MCGPSATTHALPCCTGDCGTDLCTNGTCVRRIASGQACQQGEAKPQNCDLGLSTGTDLQCYQLTLSSHEVNADAEKIQGCERRMCSHYRSHMHERGSAIYDTLCPVSSCCNAGCQYRLGCRSSLLSTACAGDPCDFGLICGTSDTCRFPSYAGDWCQATSKPHVLAVCHRL